MHFSPSALEGAIATGNGHLAKYLLDYGANAKKRVILGFDWDEKYDSLLDYAVSTGNIQVTEELLRPRLQSHHAPPEVTPQTFHLALQAKEPYILELLLRSNPEIFPSRKEMPFILEAAAFHGSLKIVQYLLQKGIPINIDNSARRGSALAAASFQGNLELVLYLINMGADLNGFGSAGSVNTPLHVYDRMTYRGMTPLQACLVQGHEDIAKQLLLFGADPKLVGHIYNGEPIITPIQLASYNCKEETIRYS
jgi:ankyrin repeat protein